MTSYYKHYKNDEIISYRAVKQNHVVGRYIYDTPGYTNKFIDYSPRCGWIKIGKSKYYRLRKHYRGDR